MIIALFVFMVITVIRIPVKRISISKQILAPHIYSHGDCFLTLHLSAVTEEISVSRKTLNN